MIYSYKPIEEVRDDFVGKKFKIIDMESNGMAIHLEDEEGYIYSLDTTGKNGVVVHKSPTEEQENQHSRRLLNALINKLEIDEAELLEDYDY